MVTFWACLSSHLKVYSGVPLAREVAALWEGASRRLGWAASYLLPALWLCTVPKRAPVLTATVGLFPQASKNAENATTGETAEENEAGD